ncbi:MAG: N-acetylmuramoyl-L-alanine amidase [Patescibacteria group bacterium]|nr:N-acetylmuramoyl-L-alanine amidase [Patescibacteria group bacterium]
MAGREVNNLNIPPEAIRTMKKDLAGITRGDWELTLAETEIEELLKKFLNRQAQGAHEQEIEERKALEEQKKKEEQEAKEKKQLAQEKESAETKIDEEKAVKEGLEKQARSISDKEGAAVAEIRKRAKEREAVVKKQMEKEEDKKSLEEERKNEEELKRKKEENLKKRLKELVLALKKIPTEKIPLEENRTYYLGEQAKILKDLEPILESERKIEENIKFIGGIEKTAITPRQRKKAEQERQLAGKERETIEKQRWDHEQKKFNIDKQLKEVDFGFDQLAQKEAKIKQEIADVNKELEKIDKEKEKIEIEKRIKKLAQEKKDYAVAKDEILEKRRNIEEKLAETINKEQKTEKEVSYIESEEKLAEDTDKQRVEKERWKIQKIRSEIEKERWILEEQVRKIRLEENRINVRYDKILEQENQLRKKVEELNEFLGLDKPIYDTEIEEKETPTKNVEEGSPPVEKKIEPEKASTPLEKKDDQVKMKAKKRLGYQKPKPIDTKTEEKPKEKPATDHDDAQKALKKIEEKKEREKLLKKLRKKREQDVEKKENQLLQRIRQGGVPSSTPKTQASAPTGQASIPTRQAPPLMTVSPEAINKKSRIKILIIAAAVIAILLIAGFWYWYVKVREDSTPEPIPHNGNSTPSQDIKMPSALIAVDSTVPHKIDSSSQILPFITQAFQNLSLSKNEFTRIAIEDTEKNKYLDFSETLASLRLDPPEILYSQMEDEATLYIFPTENYSVLGFASQKKIGTKNTDIEDIMRSWETELLGQARSLGVGLGKTNMVPIATFQENNYSKDINLRYLTLVPGPDCYGACYTMLEDKLLFATCCDPIVKIIESQGFKPADPVIDAELKITEKILSWGYRIPSTTRLIDTIVLHSSYVSTGQDPYSTDGIIDGYKKDRVTPHYLIARDGNIYHLAPDKAIAYHAGVSTMPDGRKNANDFSIGIELIYTKSDAINEAQNESLVLLIKSIRETYNIPLSNIIAHDEISPNTENSPANLDLSELKQQL